MTATVLTFVVIFVVFWAAATVDEWFKNRDAHRDCQLCHPKLREPLSRLDRLDGLHSRDEIQP